ncbi:Pentraxin-4 [Nibea albiflora]|uniref:Pentraxin-4 n=1 Tax=Nibea albiflora TaxID=240163 RepID=A0ACB7EZP2_NIBAL|nr:Pentraxin-4 [Nibea albiflora]
MGSLRPGHWPQILVHMLLLQIQPVKLQGVDSVSQKLRRLNEQQFQALTQARLDMLALNQNRNSSGVLATRIQALSEQWHHMSQDLEHLKQSTTQEIDSLRDWSRKLEKKSKRMEGRLALMERNLRENRRNAQKQKLDPGQDFFNLTMELQSQDERLAALQIQRDELLVGLRGLQESLKNQALRVTRLEGRINEVLQFNGGGKSRGSLNANVTPQGYYEPRRRSQAHRGGRPGKILDGHTHPGQEGISYFQTDHAQPQPLSQAPTHPETIKDRQSRTRLEAPQHQASDALPRPQSESYKQRVSRLEGEEEEESDTKVESSVIHNLLQLPMRQKIPAQPVPKKDATICNVDSMLFFPSASAENYVTFSLTLPNLPELSVCLWLRVEAPHVGTLLSYATNDNDNQLVLYGRNSSSSPSLDFVIGDPVHRRLPVSSFMDARWHHLCIVWSSIQGRFWHYNDRRLTSSGSNFRKGWEIAGGGSVVLGQEQDVVGGEFDAAEGFAGQVAGFRVWNRVLSPSEVEGVAEGRGVPRGVVLDMEDIKEVHGEVQQVACECLEHCV